MSLVLSLSLSCDSSLPSCLRPGVGGAGFKTDKCTSPQAQHFPLEPSRTCVSSPFMELLSNHPVGMCPLPPTGALASLAPLLPGCPPEQPWKSHFMQGVFHPYGPQTPTHPFLNHPSLREFGCQEKVAPITNTAVVTLAEGHGCTASPGNTQPGQRATRGLEPKESSWPRLARPQAQENVLSVKDQSSEGQLDQ